MNFSCGESTTHSPSFKPDQQTLKPIIDLQSQAFLVDEKDPIQPQVPWEKINNNNLSNHCSLHIDHSISTFPLENTINISLVEQQMPTVFHERTLRAHASPLRNQSSSEPIQINNSEVVSNSEIPMISSLVDGIDSVGRQNNTSNNNALLPNIGINNNLQTPNNNPESLSKTEVKLYLIRTIGFFAGCALFSTSVLYLIDHSMTYRWVFAPFYGYLIYFMIEAYIRTKLSQREAWRVKEDLLSIYKALSGLLFILSIQLKSLRILPTCLYGFLPFLLMTINYLFASQAPATTKLRRLFNNCFFTLQSFLVLLKVEGIIHFGWKLTFIPFWIYFMIVMVHYLLIISKFLGGVSAVPSLSTNNSTELDVLTQFLGLCWSFLYYGLNFVAFLGTSGFARAYNKNERSFCLLKTAAFTGLFFSSLLGIYTILAFKHLARYFRLSTITRDVSIELQVPRRSTSQRIEMKVEEKENYFIMRSYTYFLPLKNAFLFKNKERLKKLKELVKGLRVGRNWHHSCKKRRKNIDLSMLLKYRVPQEKLKVVGNKKERLKPRQRDQLSVTNIEHSRDSEKWEGEIMNIELNKQRRNRYFSLTDIDNMKDFNTEPNQKEDFEDEKFCYLCCERPSNAVLLNCGHGGICYECAVNLMKTKNKCMECRGIVDGIYKVDPNPKLFNIIKGKELTKIIKY